MRRRLGELRRRLSSTIEELEDGLTEAQAENEAIFAKNIEETSEANVLRARLAWAEQVHEEVHGRDVLRQKKAKERQRRLAGTVRNVEEALAEATAEHDETLAEMEAEHECELLACEAAAAARGAVMEAAVQAKEELIEEAKE